MSETQDQLIEIRVLCCAAMNPEEETTHEEAVAAIAKVVDTMLKSPAVGQTIVATKDGIRIQPSPIAFDVIPEAFDLEAFKREMNAQPILLVNSKPEFRLKPLDLSEINEKYAECPLTGDAYDVETHFGRAKFHAIHYLKGTMESIELGAFKTKDLAWEAIEDHRNKLVFAQLEEK